MDAVRNPYSPGAGTRPPALVGRDREIEAMDVALQRLRLGRDGRSQMLTGLRGVGKTVMLNEFEQLADGRGFFREHVEVGEDGDLAPRLAAAFRRVLLSMEAKRRIGDRIRRALGVLKAFSIRLPGGPELSIDIDAVYGPADSGDLAMDLSALFIELGEVARDHDTGLLITIDELHYVGQPTLEALVMGLHRAAQMRLPITIAGAGLPTLATLTGEAKSYAERMFTFPVIGSLGDGQAREALVVPAEDEGVTWEDSALQRVIEVTHGYPYFLQEFGEAGMGRRRGPGRHHHRGGGPEHSGGDRRARRRLLSREDGPDERSRAFLPEGNGGARSRSGPLGRRRRPAAQEDDRARSDPGRPAQKGLVLLATLGGDRLHGADVRGIHEAVDSGS